MEKKEQTMKPRIYCGPGIELWKDQVATQFSCLPVFRPLSLINSNPARMSTSCRLITKTYLSGSSVIWTKLGHQLPTPHRSHRDPPQGYSWSRKNPLRFSFHSMTLCCRLIIVFPSSAKPIPSGSLRKSPVLFLGGIGILPFAAKERRLICDITSGQYHGLGRE